MKRSATVSSTNEITIPPEVRSLLGLAPGTVVEFDVDTAGSKPSVTLRRHPSLDELAGAVPVPSDVAGRSWTEIRMAAWGDRANELR